MLISKSSWGDIEQMRARVSALDGSLTVQAASQTLAEIFASTFSSVVLARVFGVLPFSTLPPDDQAYGRRLVKDDARLKPTTPTLTLLGSRGKEVEWNDRVQSSGHRAIPLLDRWFVDGLPMIARLLADIQVDFESLATRSFTTRPMLGGLNRAFYVEDAKTAVDSNARRIIGATEFVTKYDVKTVFGMGGAYVEGTLVVAIFFVSETIPRLVVDRFPSFISNFKMATSVAAAEQRWFEP